MRWSPPKPSDAMLVLQFGAPDWALGPSLFRGWHLSPVQIVVILMAQNLNQSTKFNTKRLLKTKRKPLLGMTIFVL